MRYDESGKVEGGGRDLRWRKKRGRDSFPSHLFYVYFSPWSKYMISMEIKDTKLPNISEISNAFVLVGSVTSGCITQWQCLKFRKVHSTVFVPVLAVHETVPLRVLPAISGVLMSSLRLKGFRPFFGGQHRSSLSIERSESRECFMSVSRRVSKYYLVFSLETRGFE